MIDLVCPLARVVQLTDNTRNWVGDGCEEADDAGLSAFGRRVIREMNRVGMVVDLSHTGVRTTMEAMEASGAPCIFSHVPSRLPALTAALLRRGYTEREVRKVLGENLLRVFGQVWK